MRRRCRPGGRVWTVLYGDTPEELGGKFLSDGGEALNIRALIAEMGLEVETYEVDLSQRKYLFRGHSGLHYVAFRDGPVPTDCLLEQIRSWKVVHLGQILDRLFHRQPLLRHLMEFRMACYEGNDSTHLSPFYLTSLWDCYRRDYEFGQDLDEANYQLSTTSGGNGRLVERLTEALEGEIHYKHPLQALTRDQQGCYGFTSPMVRQIGPMS